MPRTYKNKRLLGTVPSLMAKPIVVEHPSTTGKYNADVPMADGQQNQPEQEALNMTPTNDLSQRISMGTWHPRENTFAVAKHNSLFIYTEKRSTTSSSDKGVK